MEAPEETGMEQVMSDLQALKRLYGLLHRGPADENLDETSRDLLMKMLDDATQQTLLKQAKMLSGSLMSPVLERKLSIRSDRRTRDAEPPLTLRPLVSPSPSPSIPPGERSSRLNQQYSTVSSRAGGHFDGHRQTAEEPLLARLASYRSSRTAVSALTPRHRPSGEQRNSGLSLYRLPVAATSQHGTVTGSNRHADRRDRTRQSSGRGDLSSLEGSSRRRSVSREVSLGRAWLQHGRGTGRHPGAESSSSTRRFGRLDSGLSLGMASRRGSERTGRGVAAMSRHGTVTGSNRHAGHRDRTRRTSGRGDQSSSLEGSSSRRRSVSREMSNSSSGAAVSYPSTSPTASLESSASASYSPPPVSRRGIAPPLSLHGFAPAPPVSLRGIAPPVYAPRVSRSMRRRRRQEILERRVGRLRMLKNKIDMVFHHRHDHHHHLGRGLEGPSSRLIPGEHHRKSPWRHLGEMFHRTKRQDKEITSRTVVGGAPAKRRGGGGNMHALFDAMRRHLRGKRRTPASVKMRGAANRSRVQAKKMHWWQRLRKRRGRKDVTAGIPRRRLGL
ncbi:serine/arginine repetitive matrix protein 1 [Setaria italica]|uniref:serine/arginine repetitive matrix protein 1 n=1 Tax=Setaria italica TaxID=4555 RepID=UPI00035101A8|nr:serine/arginine repetitive matrix protein 1 [Setaria italica]